MSPFARHPSRTIMDALALVACLVGLAAAAAAARLWLAAAPSARRAWRGPGRGRRSPSPRSSAADVDRARKVLFLISDTGGGHRASADALVEALGRCAPDVATEVCDLLTDVAPFPYNAAVPLYTFLAARPWLWRLVWYGTALVDRVISDGAPWPGCAAPFEA